MDVTSWIRLLTGFQEGDCSLVAIGLMPTIPIGFVKEDRVLNYLSMVTTVGTPQIVAAQELCIECMFPADQAT